MENNCYKWMVLIPKSEIVDSITANLMVGRPEFVCLIGLHDSAWRLRHQSLLSKERCIEIWGSRLMSRQVTLLSTPYIAFEYFHLK